MRAGKVAQWVKAFAKSPNLSPVPGTQMVEDETQVLQGVWPKYVYHI